jgi:4-amino-4-deoxy-L-arabinose transferase-like glycosyltransferase
MSAAKRLLVFAFCAVLLVAGLTTGDLVRNEGLRARLAAEALVTGDWLVPRLCGEPHLTKPPGMTVLIGLCSLPGGRVTDVTARLPSVLAGAFVMLAWGLTFRRLCGPPYGFMAAALVPCSFLWLDRVPSAEIDLVQLAWVSGALLCLLRAVEIDEARAPGSWPWWLAALFCVAGGLFTKWTAPAFFYLTALPWLYVRGRLGLLGRLPHLAGAVAVALLLLAWLAVAGEAAGGRALLDTLMREALLRLSPGHHPRPYPWDELATFPLSFLAGCLPWSLIALVTLAPAFRAGLDERQRRLWQLCQAWLWVNLLFWTVVPGHRPRHILPAQPAVAGLAGLAWFAWTTGRLRWPVQRWRPGAVLAGLLAGWLVVKLVHVAAVVPRRQAHLQPRVAGEHLALRVPPGRPLYVLRLKDEGVLFYYGRPARRLSGPDQVPAGAWCLLTKAEWQKWPAGVPVTRQAGLRDGQGAPLVLVHTTERR